MWPPTVRLRPCWKRLALLPDLATATGGECHPQQPCEDQYEHERHFGSKHRDSSGYAGQPGKANPLIKEAPIAAEIGASFLFFRSVLPRQSITIRSRLKRDSNSTPSCVTSTLSISRAPSRSSRRKTG